MVESTPKTTRVVNSVQHAARILRILGGAADPLSMSDVARRVNLSKTATYHLLKTLELEKFVAKDSGARYRLSWGVYELGSSVIRSIDLRQVAPGPPARRLCPGDHRGRARAPHPCNHLRR